MFAYLLLRSKRSHQAGNVTWKGRTYGPDDGCREPTERSRAHPRRTTLMKSFDPDSANHSSAGIPSATPPVARAAAPAQDATTSGQVIIEPGLSVGPLKLGDTRERALELFPKKDEDQEWENSCGTTLDWVDSTNPTGRGDVFIRLKKGKIFQIESATTRFHTAEGITTFDHADKVANAYKDMHAYTLLTAPDPAQGDRPARILDRQEERHRLRLRLLSARAQALSLQDRSFSNPTRLFVPRKKPSVSPSGRPFLPTLWNRRRNWPRIIN